MFKDYFIKLCSQKGVSMRKACMDMKISETAHTKWKGAGMPSADNIKKIADYFGIPEKEVLSMGKKEEITDISDLSKEDIQFIRDLKSLPDEKRQAILTLLKQK